MLKIKGRPAAAFTLIEMLVVVSMVSVISLAIYATLSGGLRIWQRVNLNTPAEDIVIFFEKITSDLRNAVKFSSLSFFGEEDNFEFVSLIHSHRLDKKTIGKTAYSLDAFSGVLKRYEKDIAHIFKEETGISYNAIGGVEAVRFQYYYYDEENDYYLWEDEWLGDGIPLAVRIELMVKTENASEKFTKTVSIPVGG